MLAWGFFWLFLALRRTLIEDDTFVEPALALDFAFLVVSLLGFYLSIGLAVVIVSDVRRGDLRWKQRDE